MSTSCIERLVSNGYVIVRGAYSNHEINEISNEMDRARTKSYHYSSTFRHAPCVSIVVASILFQS
jgi:hypothetical protein